MDQLEILARCEAQLAALAELDHAYFLNPAPTRSERADYHQRLEQAEQIRASLYAELKGGGTFRVRFNDATGATAVSAVQCTNSHDLKNCLGVILGNCELLADRLAQRADDEELGHLNAILEATRKAATLIQRSACPLRSGG